ncbi:type II toxin-antitoxin system PemK/MazF family toxin [Thermovibrio sp.]
MDLIRGGVYLAKLSPTKGKEPGKTRPVVIVQRQEVLGNYPTVLVAPLTSNLKGKYPLRLTVKAREKLEKDSAIMIDQIRAIDLSRLIPNRLALLTKEEMEKLEKAICFFMGVE